MKHKRAMICCACFLVFCLLYCLDVAMFNDGANNGFIIGGVRLSPMAALAVTVAIFSLVILSGVVWVRASQN